MIKRSPEALRADILVALRDFGPLIISTLCRKSRVNHTSDNIDWLLMNGYVRRYPDGSRIWFDITTDGLNVIERLANKGNSPNDLPSFVKKNWENMSDEDIAREKNVSLKTVYRVRKRLGLLKGPGGIVK